MRLLTFKKDGSFQLGVKTDSGIIDVRAAATALGKKEVPRSLEGLFAADAAARAAFDTLITEASNDGSWMLNEATLTYGPCVPNPGKILCVGLNYRQHAEESGMAIPEYPVLFSKFNNSLAAKNEDVPITAVNSKVDYEAELVVVVGKTAKNVSEADALDYVFGYCNGNDLSDRALQMLTGQWLLGKTLDKFMPIGPYLVTRDEIPDPQALPVKCWLNGELRQNSNTADMIFSVAEVIAFASKHMTLSPGDIITTGTPQGVILGLENKVWMKPGDKTIIQVGDLGQLTNKMVAG